MADPVDPELARLAERLNEAIRVCGIARNRNDDYNITGPHDAIHLTLGDLRAVAEVVDREHTAETRLRQLQAERDALLWALTATGYEIGGWCEDFTHVDGCDGVEGGCGDDGPFRPECKAANTFSPALIKVDGNHGDQFACWLSRPDKLAEFGASMDRFGYTLAAAVEPVVPTPQPGRHLTELAAVAHAAWHLMDDSGELGEGDMVGFHGDFVHLKLDHQRLSDALDALEAAGWDAHPDTREPPAAPSPQSDPDTCPKCGSGVWPYTSAPCFGAPDPWH